MSSRTGKKHREWSQEDIDAALEDVRINGKSIAEAAKNNNVPRKTLSDRYHKKVKEDTSGGGRAAPTCLVSGARKRPLRVHRIYGPKRFSSNHSSNQDVCLGH